MKCHEFENRLNEVLDQRLAPEGDVRLVVHASSCEACAQIFAGQAALLTGLRQLSAPVLRAEFADEVVAASLAPGADVEFEHRDPTIRWWVFALVATAATLLVALGVGRAIKRNRAQRDEIVKQGPLTPQSKPERAQPRGMAVATPRHSAPLAQGPASIGRPYAAYGLQIESFAATLPGAVEHLDEVERLAPGFRPLRISFVVLFDALRRTIPGWQAPPREEKPAAWFDSGSVA